MTRWAIAGVTLHTGSLACVLDVPPGVGRAGTPGMQKASALDQISSKNSSRTSLLSTKPSSAAPPHWDPLVLYSQSYGAAHRGVWLRLTRKLRECGAGETCPKAQEIIRDS